MQTMCKEGVNLSSDSPVYELIQHCSKLSNKTLNLQLNKHQTNNVGTDHKQSNQDLHFFAILTSIL